MKQARGGWSTARRWAVGLGAGGAALTLAALAWPLAISGRLGWDESISTPSVPIFSTFGKGTGVTPEEAVVIGGGGCVGDACDVIIAPPPPAPAPEPSPGHTPDRTKPERTKKSKAAVKSSPPVPMPHLPLPAPFADVHLYRPKLPGKQSGNSKKDAEDEQYPPLPFGYDAALAGGLLRTSTRLTLNEMYLLLLLASV